MRHVILTCKNHPNLRWSTKEIAITDGHYNGLRHLFFLGEPSGRGMFSDGSGLDCIDVRYDGSLIKECQCTSSELIIAPEDVLVKHANNGENHERTTTDPK